MIRRRDFITLLGGAAAGPLAARAQQAEPVRRVGALFNFRKDGPGAQSVIPAFRERLAMLGWVEGDNLRMDYRFADADPDRLAAYAEELVNIRPDLIFAISGLAARAVQQRTAVIPIVFVGAGDPASNGLVSNIARPGDNITGFANIFYSHGGKWVELFKEAIPGMTRVAHIFSTNELNANSQDQLRAVIDVAAARLGVTTVTMPIHNTAEIEPAISASAHFDAIKRLALHYRLPLMYGAATRIEEGILMSHGPDGLDLVRRAASYVIASCAAQSRASCPSNIRPNSSWWSISKPQRQSASKFRRRCSPSPMR
jgi:putative ABC transport system substrate-binding protein